MVEALLPGLEIEPLVPPQRTSHRRVDVVCFVGFVDLSAKAGAAAHEESFDSLPRVREWLRLSGWLDGSYQVVPERTPSDVYQLLHVPVPVESFSEFETLFDWRSSSAETVLPSYLGAAVRSFFAQGGRRCFVVRAGDRLADAVLSDGERENRARDLVPIRGWPEANPRDRGRWRGLSHLHELREASFVVLPDLPHLFASARLPPQREPDPVIPNDAFGPCGPKARIPSRAMRSPLGAPASADGDYLRWASVLHRAVDFLSAHRRDVQLVASIPLPMTDTFASESVWRHINQEGLLQPQSLGNPLGFGSAFVQLTYPWVRSRSSDELPGAIEPPDGVLVGALARHILAAGAFQSAAGAPLAGVVDVFPDLPRSEREHGLVVDSRTPTVRRSMRERVSLIGRPFLGQSPQVLTDVTTSLSAAFRPAPGNRLMSVWVRALEHIGEEFVFESSNEITWALLRQRVREVGLSLLRQGALAGERPSDAFRVRCDRTTISQRDIEAGLIRAEVEYTSGVPVETVRIGLATAGRGARIEGVST